MVSPRPLPYVSSGEAEGRLGEVKKMADRIIDMREKLYNALIDLKTPGDWQHIKSQIGESRHVTCMPDQR